MHSQKPTNAHKTMRAAVIILLSSTICGVCGGKDAASSSLSNSTSSLPRPSTQELTKISSTSLSSGVVLASLPYPSGYKLSQNASSAEGSPLAWIRHLLDQYKWMEIVENDSLSLPQQCRADLNTYLTGLENGASWASKMYDSSGHYQSGMLFGNEYWVGSASACRELQHKAYYRHTPPFHTLFYVLKINITLGDGYTPPYRVVLVGECVPSSCDRTAVATLAERALLIGSTKPSLLDVRKVPQQYSVSDDSDFHVLGAVVLAVGLVILVASVYEGYLERRYRVSKGSSAKGAERERPPAQTTPYRKPPLGEDIPACNEKVDDTSRDINVRRETRSVWEEVLLSFSVLSNGRNILSTDKPTDGVFNCLHGLRFLSVLWVIMVHTFLTLFHIADNKTLRIVTERSFIYQSVGNASYCVDTFFFIGGLLVTVLFLRSEDKKSAKKMHYLKRGTANKQDINKNVNGYSNPALSLSIISQQSFAEDLASEKKSCNKVEMLKDVKSFLLLFFYRVARLTPAYAFVIFLTEIALRFTHANTVFEPAIYDHITCDRYWWRNVLYINNLFPQREMCMVWSWYMANDTQFYVIGLVILLISIRHPKVALGSLGAVMVGSWITTIYVSVSHNYKARIQEPFEMFDALYDKPYSRIGPYLIGMLVGAFLHKTKCEVKIPYWAVAAGWCSALLIKGGLIFGMVDGYFEVWPTAFYVSVGHTAWGVALAWVTVACCCGYGGLASAVLSYRGLLPLSRLTYCAYLVHPTIMLYTTFLMDGPYHLENYMVLVTYAGYAVAAFVTAFGISLAFEAPVVKLLKIINGS